MLCIVCGRIVAMAHSSQQAMRGWSGSVP
ncbi:DUF2180 family protein [Pararhizobium sp.]